MTKTWWEAPMGGSVLSFLKAEWKVSDTEPLVLPVSKARTSKVYILQTIWIYIYFLRKLITHTCHNYQVHVAEITCTVKPV